MHERPIVWLGTSLAEVRAFPDRAKQAAGYALDRIQNGLEPSNWRPMPSVGPGVREIRIQVGQDFRVLYVTRFPEAIYVLHAFEKKSQKTAHHDIATARNRLASLTRP